MRFSELDGKRIAVWGLGRETRSLLTQLERHLRSAAPVVAVIEADGEAPDSPLRTIRSAELAEHAPELDVLVRSPGVSIYRPELAPLYDAGATVTTATSLWLAERGPGRVIGITGTKGKSTTATITAHLVCAAVGSAELAGNIGR